MSLPPPPPPLDPMQRFHQAVLALVENLVELDPPPDTPLGRLLEGLAAAIETYEKASFNVDSQDTQTL